MEGEGGIYQGLPWSKGSYWCVDIEWTSLNSFLSRAWSILYMPNLYSIRGWRQDWRPWLQPFIFKLPLVLPGVWGNTGILTGAEKQQRKKQLFDLEDLKFRSLDLVRGQTPTRDHSNKTKVHHMKTSAGHGGTCIQNFFFIVTVKISIFVFIIVILVMLLPLKWFCLQLFNWGKYGWTELWKLYHCLKSKSINHGDAIFLDCSVEEHILLNRLVMCHNSRVPNFSS